MVPLYVVLPWKSCGLKPHPPCRHDVTSLHLSSPSAGGSLGGAPRRVPCRPPRTASPCPLRSLSPCSPSHHDLIPAISRAPQRAIRLVTTLPPRRSQAHAGTPAAPCSPPPPPPV